MALYEAPSLAATPAGNVAVPRSPVRSAATARTTSQSTRRRGSVVLGRRNARTETIAAAPAAAIVTARRANSLRELGGTNRSYGGGAKRNAARTRCARRALL